MRGSGQREKADDHIEQIKWFDEWRVYSLLRIEGVWDIMSIATNYQKIREEIPPEVTIVLAGKMRTVEEIVEVIEAGAADIGENYVQEAEQMHQALGEKASRVNWHMIGHLQTNKINKALEIFDVIQTVDSLKRARAIDSRADRAGKGVIPVYIEINIGSEESKAGIKPEDHEPFEEYMVQLVRDISALEHLRVEGLMTMGPRFGDPENSRAFFKRTKELYETIKALGIPGVNMRHLSMGMTNSYQVAIEEGSTMVRIGTAVFGARNSCSQP
jgi:pyridoxal phosphate enzyme (YggS family)